LFTACHAPFTTSFLQLITSRPVLRMILKRLSCMPLNGGGQNMSRAMLTGALVGAQVGPEGIPKRFLDDLDKGQELVALAKKLGTQV